MRTICIIFFTTTLLMSCGKDFLDIKRNANQVVPSDIADYQALLDYNAIMNRGAFELALIGTDEYVLSSAAWAAANPQYFIHIKNGYIWAEDVYEGREVNDWNWAYERIMYANMALDVEKVQVSGSRLAERDNVRGQALFYRAFTFYQLAQAFCRPYHPETADSDLGIPLRLEYDITLRIGRGTVREVYDKIIEDLLIAVDLMPTFQINNYRPSRLAAYALLARIYRELGDYKNALLCANEVLNVKNDLLDYNDFVDAGPYTFNGLNNGLDNKEIIFYCWTNSGYLRANATVPDSFYEEIFGEEGDLRKLLYFKNDKLYFGSYGGTNYFVGLAIDEMLLIRAECLILMDRLSEAVADLDYLRRNRFVEDHYSDLLYTGKEDLMNVLSSERQKQLYMRGTRWSDMRKNNLSHATAKPLTRTIEGIVHTLGPTDPKWVWPIPDNEIIHAGLAQNPRE